MDMSMGKRIKAARTQKGFTQEYVAASLGISRQAVFKWEKDQTRPDTKNLIALAKLLDVSVDFLTQETFSAQKENAENGASFFRASLIPLILLPVCWLVGVFSGVYMEMVQIPLGSGVRMGIPFLMYGPSPFAVVLASISAVSLLAFLILIVLGHRANKA